MPIRLNSAASAAAAAEAGEAPDPPPPSSSTTTTAPPSPLTTFSATYAETEAVHFQLIHLGGQSTYLWIGGDDTRLDMLALGVPNIQGGGGGAPPASGTMLLGTGSDVTSQTMAQRLARRLGHPVFVSYNLRDDPELRGFAEKQALSKLLELIKPGAAAASKRRPGGLSKPS